MPTLLTDEAEIEEHVDRLSRSTTSPIRTATSTSRSCPTGPTRPPRPCRRMIGSSPPPSTGSRASTAGTGARRTGASASSLLHRRRVWNQAEGTWMGWERKRGKLDELNRLLRGANDTTFLSPRGPAARRARRRPVRDHPRRRHPSAQRRRQPPRRHDGPSPQPARCSTRRVGRVVEGYGVLQPRVTPTMPADRDRSLFQWVSAGPAGLDPYAAAVSDVYQDLFGEGSYTGKGIYDVDAFEAALAGRVPENALLSHDLFEGIFARAGLVTDIELFEEFPGRLRGRRRPAAPVGARRLATAPLDPRGPRRRAAARGSPASAAGRCSTTCAGRCRLPPPG